MMNYPYYRYPAVAPAPQGMPTGQGQVPPIPSGTMLSGPMGGTGGMTGMGGMGGYDGTVPGQLPLEQSFIENILRLNLGKVGTFYMTYENNREWNAKIFRGRIEAAGRDHIIISDPKTGMRFLLLMVNLDYVTFDEELNYFYQPIVGPGPGSR